MIGSLIVQVPLLVVLALVARKASRPLQASPRSDDDREVVLECAKAFVYDLAACGLVQVFRPQLGAMGVICGIFISAVLALMILLTVVDLPSRLKVVHNLAWRDGWVTPRVSLTGEPVQVVRWGRRFSFVTFALFVSIAALVGSIGSSGASPAAASDGPNVVTSTVPGGGSSNAGTSSSASTPAASPSPGPTSDATVINNCGGPTPVAVDSPTMIKFGTHGVAVCQDAKWQSWPANVAPPTTVKVTAWASEGGFGYGVIVVDGTAYLVRTTHFR